VTKHDRDGAQTGAVASARVYNTPWLASLSIFGVMA
jgi:hypothetical protein